MIALPFIKGHGTRNDFVLLPDPERAIDLTRGLVAALCDRRSGIGGDGVLRVVRASVDPEGTRMSDEAEWFMDYRNADGSIAEMCGNGVRVFARYLVDEGLMPPGEFRVATRGGVKRVWCDETGDVTVDMGVPQVFGMGKARLDGRTFEGLRISMGNPHLACVTDVPLDSLDLSVAPEVEAGDFPAGTNVELVQVLDRTHVRMRVHERGVGETDSCGTGAVAAAIAGAAASGMDGGEFTVDVLGGRLTVRIEGPSNPSFLTGPAVLVARGEWLGAR